MRLEFNENKLKTVFEVTDEGKLLLLHFSASDFDESKIGEKAKRWFTPFEVHISGENQNDHHGVKHTASSGSDTLLYKDHKYYACPRCRQTVRVPRGKGKISITCPKCKEKFIKKT